MRKWSTSPKHGEKNEFGTPYATIRTGSTLRFIIFLLIAIKEQTRCFSEAFSVVPLSTRTSATTSTSCIPNILASGKQKDDYRNDYRNGGVAKRETRLSFTTEETDPGADTGRTILALAIPALGALLVDPLLTIADTAFVGRYSESPFELAGMGSASALLTFSFYIFNFLCTATTPLVASKRASGDEAGALAVGGQALSLAFGLGSALSIALIALQEPLLDLMGAGGNEYASGLV